MHLIFPEELQHGNTLGYLRNRYEYMKTQHFHSARGCLSYILHDPITKEAAIIDSSEEIGLETYIEFLNENSLLLKYIIETHTHADHVSVAKELRTITSAQVVRHTYAPSPTKDIAVVGNEELLLGKKVIRILYTPGHTNESISLYNGKEVFTGDTLLIGGTGRTDFQIGDSSSLHQSLHITLEDLPLDTLIRPGHDYKGRNQTMLGDEFHTNPRIMMCESEFIHTMDNYTPQKPELFDHAIAENSQ